MSDIEDSVRKDLMKFASKACVDIYEDYTEVEVNRFCSKAVSQAWVIGRAICRLDKAYDKLT